MEAASCLVNRQKLRWLPVQCVYKCDRWISTGYTSLSAWNFFHPYCQHPYVTFNIYVCQICFRIMYIPSSNVSHRTVNNLVILIKQGKSEGFGSCDQPSNLTQIGLKSSIVRPCDLEIWWMTPKNNKAHLLYNIKLWLSFHIHQLIQIEVTVRKRPIWVKLDNFF